MMVGTDPSIVGPPTTIPVFIVPIKMVYVKGGHSKVFDPQEHIVSNGLNVVQNSEASPLFDRTTDYALGKADIGQTQYIDAFQRANFWSLVSKKNPGYHVLLADPITLNEQTIPVQETQGAVHKTRGLEYGTMDIYAFDGYLKKFMRQFAEINPGALPIFLTYNICLTKNGADCAATGYHKYTLSLTHLPYMQTYVYSSYFDIPKDFSADVSTLSHEIAEWVGDPFGNNSVGCSDPQLSPPNTLEVADPLEGKSQGEFGWGDYHYPLNGFTYSLQSLAFLGYFGAIPIPSVNGWLSFHGPKDNLSVCSRFTALDPLGSVNTVPLSINSSGTIAGFYSDSANVPHGFVRSADGLATEFDPPASVATYAVSLNEGGAVTGQYKDDTGVHGFVRASNGEFVTYDVPGAAGTFPDSINTIGATVGNYWDGSRYHGFERASDGTITTFDAPGAVGPLGTLDEYINAIGTIAGDYYDGTRRRGFVRANDGTFITFDVPGSTFTYVSGINSAGAIAGTYYDGSVQQGYLRKPNGTFEPFNPPGSVMTNVSGLNGAGAIVGYYGDGASWHGFVRDTNGAIKLFDISGSVPPNAFAYGINDAGTVTGNYNDGSAEHGFVGLP